MPSKKSKVDLKIRPSTASGKLQTHPSHYTTDLYSASAGPDGSAAVGDRHAKRPVTHAQGPKRVWKTRAAKDDAEAKACRRITVAAVDGIGSLVVDPRSRVDRVSSRHQTKGKIEEKINIDTLEELKKAFANSHADKTGTLELDEFKTLLKTKLGIKVTRETQIDALFMKIDWASEGSITWDEFCTYMQLEYAEKEDSYIRSKDVNFVLPAKIESLPHRDPVLRITDTPDGNFIACSQDGMVSFWSPNAELKRTRTVVNPESTSRQKTKWITDFVIMTHFNKLIVATGDREMQFFELSSFEPYCQITGLETVPLKLEYCSTGHDECLLLYGDSDGCINILLFKATGESLRLWKKMPKHEGFIASISLDMATGNSNVQFIRWHVHDDWVQQVNYYHEIRQVISCSNNANTAVVIGCTVGSTHVEQQLKDVKDSGQSSTERTRSRPNNPHGAPKRRLDIDQSVFKVYKGVKCFDFCKRKNTMVTGGMDRIVRTWNPYVPGKPTGMLRGHNAPISFLFISADDGRIYSMSTDKCLKVWDLQDQTCLITVRPKGHKIRGDLQAVHFSPVSRSVAVATDQMSALVLRQKGGLNGDVILTHKEAVSCVKYNASFKQVVTCSEGSVIKIWDFETGSPIFEYSDAHGEAAITCATFDNTGRRLITGGRDGCLKVWNYNNGHCLRVLKKDDGDEEVCSCTYVEMNRNRYVIAVGWDRQINIYTDDMESNIHHVQYPLPKWADDLRGGHQEDILSVAQCAPNLLATCSYDGEIIVWNLVSGHIFCHLIAPEVPSSDDPNEDGDLSVNQITFLKTRAFKKDSASLISSGPCGYVHFWNVFQGGALMARFKGIRVRRGIVTIVRVDKANTRLYVADNHGFVAVWNIEGYCLHQEETESPQLLASWRGHVDRITSLDVAEEHNMLMTSSEDCTARLWTVNGQYIGTFGQKEPWSIYNEASYIHPMVPYDVLIDPMSLPEYPTTGYQSSSPDTADDKSLQSRSSQMSQASQDGTTTTVTSRNQVNFVDDEMIAEKIREEPHMNAVGKRLRHEKMRPTRVDRGGPSEYQMLQCFDLAETPTSLPQQTRSSNVDNPLAFYE